MGPTRTLLMDEITTGLDASTAFLVCRCIKNLVRLREVSGCLPTWTAVQVLLWRIPQVLRTWNMYGHISLVISANPKHHST